MAIIPEQFMNAVVAIGIDQFDADGKRIWIGSGFIVERKELQNSNFSTCNWKFTSDFYAL